MKYRVDSLEGRQDRLEIGNAGPGVGNTFYVTPIESTEIVFVSQIPPGETTDVSASASDEYFLL